MPSAQLNSVSCYCSSSSLSLSPSPLSPCLFIVLKISGLKMTCGIDLATPSSSLPPLHFPPSLRLSLKRLLINPATSSVSCREKKSKANGRTGSERAMGEKKNKREMGRLYYPDIKLCDPFDKKSSFWLRMRGGAKSFLLSDKKRWMQREKMKETKDQRRWKDGGNWPFPKSHYGF